MPNCLVYNESDVLWIKSLSLKKAKANYTAYQVQAEEVDASAYDYSEDDGFYVMTDDQITAKEEATETARQAAKSTKLKTAENAYLCLLSDISEKVTIAVGDNSDTIIEALTDAGLDESAAAVIGLKLLNAEHEIELQGGSWYDIPETAHDLTSDADTSTDTTEEDTTEE